ncbi:MAG TPA: hypothetical protein VE986_06880 [Hyphomicrobiales bacterium]|nr:hypothetical protein [Hyphomicrobiales bacterium]
MTTFNNEISSADKIGLHLSEIGRIQNNAGSLMQFMAILFAVCIYFYNDIVYPATDYRLVYGIALGADALLIFLACCFYLRSLTLSVGWSRKYPHPKTKFHLLSALPEEEIEKALHGAVRSFRRGTYCFCFGFLGAFVLIVMVAFGQLDLIPK